MFGLLLLNLLKCERFVWNLFPLSLIFIWTWGAHSSPTFASFNGCFQNWFSTTIHNIHSQVDLSLSLPFSLSFHSGNRSGMNPTIDFGWNFPNLCEQQMLLQRTLNITKKSSRNWLWNVFGAPIEFKFLSSSSILFYFCFVCVVSSAIVFLRLYFSVLFSLSFYRDGFYVAMDGLCLISRCVVRCLFLLFLL